MQNFMTPIKIEAMLAAEADRVEGIKTAAGVRPEVWDGHYLPVLKAFGNFVQQLPLSRTVYMNKNGAFEFGLISCLVALNFASSKVFFPDIKSEERRLLEPQCRYVAFVATLSSVVVMLAQHGKIYSAKTQNGYHPLTCATGLFDWLTKNPESEFSWRIGPQLTSPESAAIAARFVPRNLMANFDERVVLMMYGSIAPQLAANGVETTLTEVVRRSLGAVTKHFESEDRKRYEFSGSSAGASGDQANSISASLLQSQTVVTRVDPLDIPVSAAGQPAQPPSNSSPTSQQSAGDGALLIANADLALQEWFKELKNHEHFANLKSNLKVTDKGIEVPLTMLGKFGVTGGTIRSMMEAAKLVVSRTDDARGLVLNIALRPFLFGE